MNNIWVFENPKIKKSISQILIDRYYVRRFPSFDVTFPAMTADQILICSDDFSPDHFFSSKIKEEPIILIGSNHQKWISDERSKNKNIILCYEEDKIWEKIEKKKSKKSIKYFNITLFFEDFYFWVSSEKICYFLSPKETKILKFMMQYNQDEILSKDDLKIQAWGDQVYVSDRTIDSHISHLRQKLNPHGITIQNIYGKGFRLEYTSNV